jgi:rhamnosyltransferase
VAQLSPNARIAALVVTYLPDQALPERLNRLREQVERLVIVDNGSDAASLVTLQRASDNVHVSVVRNAENLGIATALNQGIAILAAEGYDWIFTSDQDSVVVEGCIAALIETVAQDPDAGGVALVGANRQEGGDPFGHRWLRPRKRPPFFERVTCDRIDSDGVTLVITSGTLMSVAAFRELGPFTEELFIDFVDFEYCLRARRAGYRILVSCAARLLHRVGVRAKAQLSGVTLSPTHHGPLRKYYLFRNAIAVMRKYGATFPHWLIYQLAALLEILLGILFVEERKLPKLRACMIGIWDGILGRKGAALRRF